LIVNRELALQHDDRVGRGVPVHLCLEAAG
jgi:hypothetical protein